MSDIALGSALIRQVFFDTALRSCGKNGRRCEAARAVVREFIEREASGRFDAPDNVALEACLHTVFQKLVRTEDDTSRAATFLMWVAAVSDEDRRSQYQAILSEI